MYLKNVYDRFIKDLRRSALNEGLRMQIQYRYILKLLFLIVLITSALNLATERYTMGILMLILTAIYFGLYWVVHQLKEKGVRIVTFAMIILSTIIVIFVIMHGTTDAMAALWILLFPILSLLLTGRKTGIICSTLILLIILFFYWTPFGHGLLLHEYEPIFMQRYPFVYVFMMMIAFFYESLRGVMVEELHNQHEQMESIYQNQYSSMTARIAEAKKSRHDQRHHVILLKQLISEGKYQEAEAYMDEVYQAIPFEESLSYCEHYATNALLTYYSQLAKNEHIPFDVQVSFPEKLPFQTNDLTVIFGNLIENAFQACVNDQQEKHGYRPWIRISGRYNGQNLLFQVENASLHKAEVNDQNHYISSKHEGTGIGIQSVQSIVEDHQGVFTIEQKDGLFSARVLL